MSRKNANPPSRSQAGVWLSLEFVTSYRARCALRWPWKRRDPVREPPLLNLSGWSYTSVSGRTSDEVAWLWRAPDGRTFTAYGSPGDPIQITASIIAYLPERERRQVTGIQGDYRLRLPHPTSLPPE
jgi:hypothetical protein